MNRLRRIALLFSSVITYAQTVSLTGPATAKAGSTVTINVTLAGNTATGPAAAQWKFIPPSGYGIVSKTVGAQATAATKALACHDPTSICMVYGMNLNVIANGALAQYQISIPTTARGNVTFALADVVAADRNGGRMVANTNPFTFAVFSLADLNSDGSVTAADAQLMEQMALGATVCIGDQDGDGKCDVVDVQIIVKASGAQ